MRTQRARHPRPKRTRLLAIVACSLLALSPALGETRFPDQGWTQETRNLFYFTPQGSRMIPYAWFRALEIAEGTDMFADSANLARYGFIPADGPHRLNPDALPIGFAIEPAGTAAGYSAAASPDPAPSAGTAALPTAAGHAAPGPYLGLTCAACHTANITVDDRPIRIDGGQALLDFDRFYADLATTVTRTLFDPAKFQRFAGRVLAVPSVTGASELQLHFAAFQAKLAGEAALRRPTLASGYSRVDALTQIVNSLSVRDQGEPTNLRAVDAPTSYPPLWLTPELEFVQWNPIAGNPIGRNGGEVLGVFGAATLTGEAKDWYASTLRLRDLHAIETWIGELKPPKWEESIYGAVDRGLAETGEKLFRENCSACHNAPPYRRTDPAVNLFKKTFIEIGRIPYTSVGTDPVYVESLLHRLVQTNPATARLQENKAVVPAAQYFLRTVGAVVNRAIEEARLSDDERAAFIGFRLRPPKTQGGPPEQYTPRSLIDMKAGPLAGVWATGPYLHNGSVPTVYELLSPVEERRKVFWTGARELDRQRLGFISDEAPGRFRFDTSLPGNRNIGHLYPPRRLTHDERMAVIEYLKAH
jgi:mono/diheme cytochrome c family protein